MEVEVGMAGFESHQRRRRGKAVPERIRRVVFARDGRACQLGLAGCTGDAEEVDHIVPWFEGGREDLGNLRAVCRACHKLKTQAEAQRGRARVSAKRSEPVHPASRVGLADNAARLARWAEIMGKGNGSS